MKDFLSILALALFVPAVHGQVIGTSLCNTGRTAKPAKSGACLATSLVTPINPESGGPIVDGNWEIASPYPSAPYTSSPPNPCLLATDYVGAPVSTAFVYWYNPDDGFSQWIGPNGGESTPEGWYIYRTTFLVPRAYPGYSSYSVNITGQYMADNQLPVVYLQDIGGASPTCNAIAAFPLGNAFYSWNSFLMKATVAPGTRGVLYFLVYNSYDSDAENPTGLRVEFQSLDFFPYE